MRMLQHFLWLSFALAGCAADEYASLGLVNVSGKITLDGKPLVGAKVSFFGDDKRDAIGLTDTKGQYTLMYDSKKPGTTPGSKTVRITQADAHEEGADPDAPTSGEGAVKEPIPARYNRESTLKVEVAPDKTKFDFDLKSA